jgi:hypothetical protein
MLYKSCKTSRWDWTALCRTRLQSQTCGNDTLLYNVIDAVHEHYLYMHASHWHHFPRVASSNNAVAHTQPTGSTTQTLIHGCRLTGHVYIMQIGNVRASDAFPREASWIFQGAWIGFGGATTSGNHAIHAGVPNETAVRWAVCQVAQAS